MSAGQREDGGQDLQDGVVLTPAPRSTPAPDASAQRQVIFNLDVLNESDAAYAEIEDIVENCPGDLPASLVIHHSGDIQEVVRLPLVNLRAVVKAISLRECGVWVTYG